MSTVVVNATMSVDGFVADGQDGITELFGWYGNGDIVMKTAREDLSFSLSPEDALFLEEFHGKLGALVVGRRLFDITDGWSGLHPLDVPVVVVTHAVPDEWIERFPDAPFTFVTEAASSAPSRSRARSPATTAPWAWQPGTSAARSSTPGSPTAS